MLVKIEYISKVVIEETTVSIYVTDDSRIYVGMEIMPYLKTPKQVRQTLITDIDSIQYDVYPIVEVFKFIKKKDLILTLNTAFIEYKEPALIPIEKKVLTTENEFALALKRMTTPKKKK